MRTSPSAGFYESVQFVKDGGKLAEPRGTPFFYPSVVPRQCRVAQVGCFEGVKTAQSINEPLAQAAVERIFSSTGSRVSCQRFLLPDSSGCCGGSLTNPQQQPDEHFASLMV